jgi:hypothetical protein
MKMEMLQMIERLLAGQKQMMAARKANQEKAESNREHIQQMMAKIETDRKEMIARMDANQVRMSASLREDIQSVQMEMRSIVDAWIANMRDGRKEMMACHKK